MIKNKRYIIKKSDIPSSTSLLDAVEKVVGKEAIRWYISQITSDEITVEATLYTEQFAFWGESVEEQYYPGKSAVLNIVPTGIGCSIGGYAGDATPAANLLACTADYLITNPNTVNASNFINLKKGVVYAEGHSIDLFCQGLVNFYLPHANKVGVIIEQTEDWKIDIIFNIINAVRAIYGVDILDPVITDGKVRGRCRMNEAGCFVGTVDHPEVLFNASKELIKRGADAIAVTTEVQDLPSDMYAKHFIGECPNPVGGVEAIISHLIMKKFQIPVAHAPLINIKELNLEHSVVDARGAGEMASTSGLACVLVGLQKAPQLKVQSKTRVADIINLNNLLAVVVPATSLGGVPILHAQKHNVPVIAVQENQTVLDVSQSKIQLDNVISVNSYAEASGIILALKDGINLDSISRPFATLRK